MFGGGHFQYIHFPSQMEKDQAFTELKTGSHILQFCKENEAWERTVWSQISI